MKMMANVCGFWLNLLVQRLLDEHNIVWDDFCCRKGKENDGENQEKAGRVKFY